MGTAVPARRRSEYTGGVRGGCRLLARGACHPDRRADDSPLRACPLSRSDGAAGPALAAARDGLKVQERSGYGQWDAELHRLEGIALLGLNRLEEGQAALEEALRIARRQQAKAYELRAATSLARLWGEQGRPAKARELLVPAYGWFTEGFDTADLKNAKTLLEALA